MVYLRKEKEFFIHGVFIKKNYPKMFRDERQILVNNLYLMIKYLANRLLSNMSPQVILLDGN
jgi:hypothetical protein